jgi:phosphoserine phosphatase
VLRGVPAPLRLAVFDLDGTLVPTTTVCLHLAECMGHIDELRDVERRYATHEISNTEVAAFDAPHYAGLSLDDVERRLDSIPCIAGIAETVEALRRSGMDVLLATVTWRFAAEHFARRYGFDAVCGCEMTVTDGRRLRGAAATSRRRTSSRSS